MWAYPPLAENLKQTINRKNFKRLEFETLEFWICLEFRVSSLEFNFYQVTDSGRIVFARALKIKFAASSSGNLFNKTMIVVSREGR